MNITIYNGSQIKSEMYSGNIDFDTGADTFKAMLVRNGFTFQPSNHKYRKNIKATTGSIHYRVNATSLSIIRRPDTDGSSYSFVADGFVPGNIITSNSATNPGPFRVVSVAPLTLRVALVDEATITSQGDATPTWIETGVTFTADDEAKTINLTVELTAEADDQSFTLSGANAGDDWYDDHGIRVGDVFTTGDGTNTGPYQVVTKVGDKITLARVGGAPAIVDDASSSYDLDNTYTQSEAGAGDKEVTFTVDGDNIILDSFDLSDFGPSRWGCPGALIYDYTNSDKPIVCYIKFSNWTTSF